MTEKEDTKGKIIKAAISIFSQIGYDGARVDEIAEKAGVNKAALYYHIGDKKKLYETVLKETFKNIFDDVIKQVEQEKEPEEKLKVYLDSLIRNMYRNNFLPPIMMRELSSWGRNLPETLYVEYVKIFECIIKILKEGEEKGVFIKTSPLVVHYMVVASNAFLIITDFLIRKIIRSDVETDSVDEVLNNDNIMELKRLVLRSVLKKDLIE